MQKVLLAAATAAALATISFTVAAATQQGAFLSVNGGSSHYDVSRVDTNFNDFDDRAFGATTGYRWVVDRPLSVGVEAGYVDLGQISMGQGHNTYSFNDKVRSRALVLGGNGKWDLPHGFTLTARAGVAYSRTKVDEAFTDINYVPHFSQTTTHYRDDSNNIGVYGGLGFGYDFNENIGITATYDYYALKADKIPGDNRPNHKRTVDVGVTGLNLEYRFW